MLTWVETSKRANSLQMLGAKRPLYRSVRKSLSSAVHVSVSVTRIHDDALEYALKTKKHTKTSNKLLSLSLIKKLFKMIIVKANGG